MLVFERYIQSLIIELISHFAFLPSIGLAYGLDQFNKEEAFLFARGS